MTSNDAPAPSAGHQDFEVLRSALRVQFSSGLIKEAGGDGQPVDAASILSRHPELLADKSAVIDLAYEEYCQRLERGEAVDPDQFCEKFSAYRSSLGRLLDAHRFFQENPQLLGEGPVSWPEVGQTFLGFRLQRELGRGTFARVFLATEAAVGDRRVAVKISRQGAAEADTLGRLHHRHVVPINSVAVDPATGLSAICMPFLGSATLREVVELVAAQPEAPLLAAPIWGAIAQTTAGETPSPDRGIAPEPETLWTDAVARIALALCDGLAFVHAKGILHRDLKPSNVLLNVAGEPLLLDFNLASGGNASEQQRVGGTLPYMAPEQLRPGGAADVRSDLYSLGVIVYELLAGRHPLGAIPLKCSIAEVSERLLQQLAKGPRPLREANRWVDDRLARLVESCLAADPAQRPPSAAELAHDLRQYLRPLPRLRRWSVRHAWKLQGAAVVLLLAAGAGIGFLSLRDPYSVRESRRGEESSGQGRYSEAVEHFNRSLDADPNLVSALFERGRARQRLGEFSEALVDYRKAHERFRDGRYSACAGYCLCRLGQFGDAAVHFARSVEEGFQPAEVFNDLGYAYLALSKFDQALTALDRAVEIDPDLQAALHNRALVRLHLARATGGKGAADGRSDIEKAVAVGPLTANLCWDAACLGALNQDFDAALSHLQQSVSLGLDPRKFQGDRLFSPLRGKPLFQELLRTPPPASPPKPAARLLDPLRQ